MEIFACAFCALVLLDLTMALYHYFKPADNVLPSPTGDLSSSVSLATTKKRGQCLAVNAKIKTVKISSGEEMGFSRKFGPAKISCYMVWHLHGCIVDDNAKCFDLPPPLPTSLLPSSHFLLFFSPHSSPSSLLGRHI